MTKSVDLAMGQAVREFATLIEEHFDVAAGILYRSRTGAFTPS